MVGKNGSFLRTEIRCRAKATLLALQAFTMDPYDKESVDDSPSDGGRRERE